MKNFKKYLTEETGVANHVVWNSSDRGTATLMIPKKEFDKNKDASSLAALKTRVHNAKVLTKLKADDNTIKNAGGVKDGKEYYLVHVEFSTKAMQAEANSSNEPPTNVELTKDKQDREKEDLKKRQDRESEKARETDFRKKETDRRKDAQAKDAKARAKKLGEVLEVGTDETTSTFKKYVPGQ